MCFVSKKKYNELLEQKKDFERIATDAVTQNGRLLEDWDAAIKKMEELQKDNLRLTERNEGLLARCRELEAKLDFVIKQRDYYYDLLESANEMEE